MTPGSIDREHEVEAGGPPHGVDGRVSRFLTQQNLTAWSCAQPAPCSKHATIDPTPVSLAKWLTRGFRVRG